MELSLANIASGGWYDINWLNYEQSPSDLRLQGLEHCEISGHAGFVKRLVTAPASHTRATGFYGPSEYLSDGGGDAGGAPEFYWELEVKRLSKDFHPTEKLFKFTPKGTAGVEAKPDENVADISLADADADDFAAALKSGEIKPADPAKATKQNDTARAALAALDPKAPALPPEEFDSEFADYHRGAYAFWLGKDHWDDARKAWEALLKRPPGQRHFRSVWAAFMLGKMAMKNGDPKAVEYFQLTRQLAQQGFADSIGMAADSYGWEGRSEWKQGHPEKAAPLFLTQLALGDESAIVSLKTLVPDREPVDGLLNYGPELEDIEKWSADEKKAHDEKTLALLKAAAADPLLRRLVTAHILATGTGVIYADNKTATDDRARRWLAMMDAEKIGKVQDAEYLGWLAYSDANYKEAAHWLALADPDSPAACWLQAKLQLRAGKMDDAVKSLAKAWETIHDENSYTGWNGDPNQGGPDFNYTGDPYGDGESWTFPQAISGDLGVLRLSRADFTQALEVFLKGGLWEDAAYVAERVLTADELKAYVDKQPAPATDATEDRKKDYQKLRYLLGRRLVREDRYDEAAIYLTKPYDKMLGKYVQALKDGANEKLPKMQRAQAWYTAAWIARYDGMELMGTEVAPDGFVFEGDFESTDIGEIREAGHYEKTEEKDVETNGVINETEVKMTVPFSIKVSKDELARLAKNKISPDVRFHYRIIAGALAMRAAPFLADNTDELADVINTAGFWVKDGADKVADRYYTELKKRVSKTKIGRAAIAKHWFVDQDGPWNKSPGNIPRRDAERPRSRGAGYAVTCHIPASIVFSSKSNKSSRAPVCDTVEHTFV